MRILVIGETGQMARSLVERASATESLELVALGRDRIDLERPETILPAIEIERPDIVVNAAAYTAVDDAEDDEARALAVNAIGAGEAARASSRVGARFIHLSTDYVFDGSGDEARDESAGTSPLGAYGRTKLAGEEAVRAANSNALILRTSWVYSPFGKNFVRTMIAAAKQQQVVRVVDDQRGNPTSACDLADGIITAASQGWSEGGLFHLAGTGDASWAEFAGAIMAECERLGLPSADIVPITSADYPTRARRPRNSILDSGRFAEEFGFTMPLWRTSLPDIVKRIGRG